MVEAVAQKGRRSTASLAPDMNITKRDVHPREQTIRATMDRARGVEGGYTAQILNSEKTASGSQPIGLRNFLARPERLELPTYWFEANAAQGIRNLHFV